MFQNKRATRSEGTRRRRFTFTCRPELLEGRQLLAATSSAINLINVATSKLGVQENGPQQAAATGWSVTDVGNINGSGYDSYVVASPGANGTSALKGAGAAYLIFGSQQTNGATLSAIPWNSLAAVPVPVAPATPTTDPRQGTLTFINNSTQTNLNSANTSGGFYNSLSFAGVKITSNSINSQLGYAVADLGDITGTGYSSFIIGAPNALNANSDVGSSGAGRAYIITGGPGLTTTNIGSGTGILNVDQPSSYAGAGIIVSTLVTNRLGSRLGAAVAGAGDFIADGFADAMVGAPDTTIGTVANVGAAYLISGTVLRNLPTTINVDGVGQTNATVSGVPYIRGITFTGTNTNDHAGAALAGNFSFNGARLTGLGRTADVLIGAPQTNGPLTAGGVAYMIYGAVNVDTNKAAADPNNASLLTINLGRVATPIANTSPVQYDVYGASFAGPAGGNAGFSVASAGNVNGSSAGLNDIMIGDPLTNQVYLITGVSVANNLVAQIQLNNVPSYLSLATFTGPTGTAASDFGYSLTAVRDINGDGINEIAIGAPLFSVGAVANSGAVYLIPGSTAIAATNGGASYNLAVLPVGDPTLDYSLITLPSGGSGSNSPAFLGTALAGNPILSGVGSVNGNSIFGDKSADLIIGADGYSIPGQGSSYLHAGTSFALDGAVLFNFLGKAGTGSGATGQGVQVTIAVNGTTAPYTVDASKSSMQIYVYNTTGFVANTIDPTTIVVNGIAYPNATLTQGNGFAIITITPISSLGLSNGSATISISGATTAAAGTTAFSGSTGVTVINASSNNGSGSGFVAGGANVGFQVATTFPPPYGERLIPTLSQLKQPVGYPNLTASVSLAQFAPSPAYIARNQHGITTHKVATNLLNGNALITHFGHFRDNRGFLLPKKTYASHLPNTGIGVLTLGYRVFTHNPALPQKQYNYVKARKHK